MRHRWRPRRWPTGSSPATSRRGDPRRGRRPLRRRRHRAVETLEARPLNGVTASSPWPESNATWRRSPRPSPTASAETLCSPLWDEAIQHLPHRGRARPLPRRADPTILQREDRASPRPDRATRPPRSVTGSCRSPNAASPEVPTSTARRARSRAGFAPCCPAPCPAMNCRAAGIATTRSECCFAPSRHSLLPGTEVHGCPPPHGPHHRHRNNSAMRNRTSGSHRHQSRNGTS